MLWHAQPGESGVEAVSQQGVEDLFQVHEHSVRVQLLLLAILWPQLQREQPVCGAPPRPKAALILQVHKMSKSLRDDDAHNFHRWFQQHDSPPINQVGTLPHASRTHSTHKSSPTSYGSSNAW